MGRPRVLLFSCQTWPTAALFADALIQFGVEVGALRPGGNPIAALDAVAFQQRYSHPFRHAALTKAVAALQPDLIVPCDDDAVAVLHEHRALCLRQAGAEARVALIEASLGDPAMYETVLDKSRFIALARDHGIATPQSVVLRDEADFRRSVAQGPWPKVVKVERWSGGRGVRIVHNADEAAQARRDFAAARSALTMVKDAIRDGSTMPLYRQSLLGDPVVTVQAFAPGAPVNRAVICHEGRVLAGRTFETIQSLSATGHSTVVRVRHLPAVNEAVARCVALLGLSGVAGFDFMYDERDGGLALLEVNPRVTAALYAAPTGWPPLAKALADRLSGRPIDDPEPALPERAIALFPQEFERDPNSAYLTEADYAPPHHAPALVEACLQQARHLPLVQRLTRPIRRRPR